MQLPVALIQSLQDIPGFNEQEFVNAHHAEQRITSVRLNPAKAKEPSLIFEPKNIQCTPVPWTTEGYYLSTRPSFTFDPIFHAGAYYVQEASSMFLEQVIRQSVDLSKPLRVLDLCAAPGGKSTHLQSLLSENSLLVSNEVIRQRVNILKDNIIKWGCSNVIVTNNDPKDFSKLKGFFDVIVVDAPCSGSGLFRRDEDAIDEWSENNVTLCAQRQQRILADIIPALKEGGVLIYATCSYSIKEDEEIADWLSTEYSLINIPVALQPEWNITEVATVQKNKGYRFWPHIAKGEGFFITAFQKEDGITYKNKTRINTQKATKQLLPIVSKWATIGQHELIQVANKVYAWPCNLFSDFDLILQNLRVIYSGTLIGELMHQKLIPEHALAMSNLCNNNLPKLDLDDNDAITYLQKNPLQIECTTNGWHLVVYKTFPLGWANVLTNRINNYYPKEFRILKSAF